MKIATPIATMGIRGTTGVVDVPQAGAAGGGGEASPGSSSTRTPMGMWGGSRSSTSRADGSASSPRARARLRSAWARAGGWRRCLSRFRRRRRRATAPYSSACSSRTQSDGSRRSAAVNCGGAISSPVGSRIIRGNRTRSGGPAARRRKTSIIHPAVRCSRTGTNVCPANRGRSRGGPVRSAKGSGAKAAPQR